eukprot:366021-Chlamydomonas_euryale.AAC.24
MHTGSISFNVLRVLLFTATVPTPAASPQVPVSLHMDLTAYISASDTQPPCQLQLSTRVACMHVPSCWMHDAYWRRFLADSSQMTVCVTSSGPMSCVLPGKCSPYISSTSQQLLTPWRAYSTHLLVP